MSGLLAKYPQLPQFIMAYGSALISWAQVEDELCVLFGLLVGIQPEAARALFFSGRSFATRADLYSAAIATSACPEAAKKVHRAILKKARRFSSARNSIAHGVPAFIAKHSEEGIRIKQGQRRREPGGITLNEFGRATDLFQDLIDACISLAVAQDDEAWQECLARVRELPSEVFPRGDAQTGEEPE
jgi:hypothetical protein